MPPALSDRTKNGTVVVLLEAPHEPAARRHRGVAVQHEARAPEHAGEERGQRAR